MTGSSYEQMKQAMLALGRYSMKDGTYVNAEILSYSAGIDMVKERFKKILGEIFLETAEDYGLNMFEDLFLLKIPRENLTERRKQIKRYLSLKKGFPDRDFYDVEVDKNIKSAYTILKNKKVTVINLDKESGQFHNQLCSFLTRYSQFMVDISVDGNGETWNRKELKARNWNYLDSAMMSFDIHDTL